MYKAGVALLMHTAVAHNSQFILYIVQRGNLDHHTQWHVQLSACMLMLIGCQRDHTQSVHIVSRRS